MVSQLDEFFSADAGNVSAQTDKLLELKKSLREVFASEPTNIVTKEITAGLFTDAPGGGTGGTPMSLRGYDLHKPAQWLTPRNAPLRNSIPRYRMAVPSGAHEYRQFTGLNNTRGIGNLPDVTIAFDSETTTSTWGGLSLLRQAPMQMAARQRFVTLGEQSVSNQASTRAFWTSLGFDNTDEVNALSILTSHFAGEEQQLLFGNGPVAAGYSGPFGGGVTPSAPTATASTTGGTLATGSYTVAVAVRAGNGRSVSTSASSATSVTGPTGSITVTTEAIPAGAAGIEVYAELSGTWYYAGLSQSGTSFVIKSLGVTPSFTFPVTSDTTAPVGSYDGLLTVTLNDGGQVMASTGPIAGSSGHGDADFQTLFLQGYENVYWDPDELYLNAAQASALGTWLRSEPNSTAYRLMLHEDNVGGAAVGSIVSGIYNQASPTQKMVSVHSHPFMPYGSSLIRSINCPVEYVNAGVPGVAGVVCAQDYQYITWPQIQFSRDASSYAMSTLCVYVPELFGSVTGLT